LLEIIDRDTSNQPIIVSDTSNHPVIVVFDEPGQQEIESTSLFEFLHSAARSFDRARQVIVSTSEPLEAQTGFLTD
jgi:hypothetical protein